MSKTRAGTALAAMAAAVLFIGSLELPVWHMRMEAPQYQGEEALRVRVYPGSIAGDVREIGVLNRYIGVRMPRTLPQFRWLPPGLLGAAFLGVLALALPAFARSRGYFGIAALVTLLVLVSAIMAQVQMRRIGHERDPHAALKGVANFTPPVLGRIKVANFEITTGLGSGALLITAGILFEIAAGVFSRREPKPRLGDETPFGDVRTRAELAT